MKGDFYDLFPNEPHQIVMAGSIYTFFSNFIVDVIYYKKYCKSIYFHEQYIFAYFTSKKNHKN